MNTMNTDQGVRLLKMSVFTVFFGMLYTFQMSEGVQAKNSPDLFAGFQQVQKSGEMSDLYVSRSGDTIPTVSLNAENVLLVDILHQLAEELNVDISMNTRKIEGKLISYQARDKNIYSVLNDLLYGTELEVHLSEDQKVLIIQEAEEIEANDIFQETVSGQVIDAQTGEALPGVNIVVDGTTTGTTTDVNGNFELDISSLNETLVFSFIGYQTQEIPLEGRSEINVEMVSQAIAGEELVVIGYGTVQRRDLTGSVSSTSIEDFTSPSANASVEQLIQGKIAGVNITQNTGEPGGGISVKIRGVTSLGAGSKPLYVVDGLPMDNRDFISGSGGVGTANNPNAKNPLNSLNPNDIQSIEILKDASAAAIYGARAAGGVVLITTKKGTAGATQIDYGVQMGWQTAIDHAEVLSTQEYIEVINGISQDAGDGLVFSDSDINNIGAGTNWLDQVLRTAPMASHNLSVSGGDENSTYRASLNFFDQDGIIKDTGHEKYVARLNLNTQLQRNTQFGLNINASVINDNNSVDGGSIDEASGPYNSAIMYDPTEPIYNEDGSFNRSPNLTVDNPVTVVEGVTSVSATDRVFGDAIIEHNLFETLSARVNFGYDKATIKRDIYNSRITINGSSVGGMGSKVSQTRENINLEFLMDYNVDVANHSVNVTGGTTYQEFSDAVFSGSISTFPVDAILTNNFNLGDASSADIGSNKEKNNLLSYLTRVNYSFQDTYLLTGSVRVDGSSRFGANNRWGVFPSVAFAWRLTENPVIPDTFSELKFRASWGRIGNQEIGNLNNISTFSPGASPIFNNQPASGLAPTRIPNPDLKWETTEQYNIGLDLGLFENRISGTIDVFLKETSDMLVNQPVQSSSGFSSVLRNVGDMENKGIELMIRSINISQSDFIWRSTLNFTHTRNKVTDIGGGTDVKVGGFMYAGNTATHRVGEPVASYFGHEITGIFQEGDDIAGSAQPNAKPGDPIVLDANNDGVIDARDRVILGDPHPDFTYGIQNTFNYKNFQLNIFIQGSQGADLLSIDLAQSMFPTNFRLNRLAEPLVNRWTPDNPSTKYPNFVNTSSYDLGRVNSFIVRDASFIRLKNVQLSYEIPQNYFRSANISITGTNLYTITDYVANPDVNTFGGGNTVIDFANFPLARTFLFGIEIGI